VACTNPETTKQICPNACITLKQTKTNTNNKKQQTHCGNKRNILWERHNVAGKTISVLCVTYVPMTPRFHEFSDCVSLDSQFISNVCAGLKYFYNEHFYRTLFYTCSIKKWSRLWLGEPNNIDAFRPIELFLHFPKVLLRFISSRVWGL